METGEAPKRRHAFRFLGRVLEIGTGGLKVHELFLAL